MRARLAAFVLLAAFGCAPKKPAMVPAPPAPFVDAWQVGTTDPRASEPALLWNGLIGVRLGRFAGLEDSAEASFFAIDEYETAGEEKIRPLPNPIRPLLDTGSNPFSGHDARDYSQVLDLRNGVLTTQWKEPNSSGLTQIRCETVMHPTERIVAQRWTVTPEKDASIDLGPDGDFLSKEGLQGVEADADGVFRFTKLGPAELRWAVRAKSLNGPASKSISDLNVKGGQEYVAEIVWSFGRGARAFEMLAARGTPVKANPAGGEAPIEPPSFAEVYQAALDTWRERWETDIEIDGPVEDQQAVRSFLFYLRSSIHPAGGMSVSPFGLSNAMYHGHVFWDADAWVFPALSLVDPLAAAQIPLYRLSRMPAAQYNFYSWLDAKRPTANGAVGPIDLGGIAQAQKFPWESSVTGKETVPGPSKFEDHITGTVAFSMANAAALDLVPPEAARLVREGAASFYTLRSVPGPQGREIRDVMSPDENHVGDNDLYTNLLAEWATGGGRWKGTPTFKLPRDEKSFLTYDDDPLRGYKQAAAVLSVYPLQYPPAEKQARAMMERFGDKTIENGPAMSDSVHATIWARLGEERRAYDAWRESWVPFTRGPLMLFSEKRRRSQTYFTTGAGGALQTVLFGFLGFRLDYRQEPGSAWSQKLRGETWLSVKPNLPSEWKSVKFRNFTVLGRRFTLTASPSAVRVVPGG